MLKLGTNNIDKIYLGNTKIERAYLGDTLVYGSAPAHDYSKDYLTFEALEDGTFTLTIPQDVNSSYMTSVSYSTDNGETWTTTTVDNTAQTITTPTITGGNKVLWRGVGTQMTTSALNTGRSYFSSTGNFNVSGNIMSLLYGDNFQNNTSFNSGSNYNLANIFKNATKLTDAVKLMLPATTLASSCYHQMFYGCTSLTTAPELPATTLVDTCYSAMFYGCTSLATAPELPATTLVSYCYSMMFRGCTSLTTAPELPATTLASYCYHYMFDGCSKLNYIKAMFTTTPSNAYTRYWVSGVASTGTFVKNSTAQWNVSGVNGIPSGWTVQTASS